MRHFPVMMHLVSISLGMVLLHQPIIGFPGPAGAAGATVTATAAVKGPVTFELEAISCDIVVRPGSAKVVKITVVDTSAQSIKLVARGDRIVVVVDSGQPLRDGDVAVELPAGSSVELVSISGDIQIDQVGGAVKATATSGDITVTKASKVDVTAVSGDLRLKEISGPVRGRTVSGDARVVATGGAAARLEFETTSGELEWRGQCGKGCSLEVKTLSGDVDLVVDKASAFTLAFTSYSGDLDDDLKMKVLESKQNKQGGGQVKARYGSGDGAVAIGTFAGELSLRKD